MSCLLHSVQLLIFTSSPSIMGEGFVNTILLSSAMWCIAALVVAINAWAVFEAITSQVDGSVCLGCEV